ncbi:unnamed protein product [Cladocopium goreaui]|uniref:Swarming motility protein YbiA n=1 Tax=Cladocopium goreaui TaxID=2562237 RepID=A0A9P1M1V3_9DINO|nr:unnamed protein product [Cladocopium goreaui]
MPNVQVRSLFWGEAEAKKFLEQHGVRAHAVTCHDTVAGPFDLILCCEVVYQLPQQVWEALQQTLRQLLVPGGRVVGDADNHRAGCDFAISKVFAYQHRDGAEAVGGRSDLIVTDAVFFQTLEQAANLRFDQEACGSLQSLGGFHS